MKFKTKHTINFANSANEKEENEYLKSSFNCMRNSPFSYACRWKKIKQDI